MGGQMDNGAPDRLPTPKAQHPAASTPGRGAPDRPRRRLASLPPDWEAQLRALLSAVPFPARWLDVLAAALRNDGDDWVIELVGRLPEVDFTTIDAIVELCRPQVRQGQISSF